MSFLFIAAYPSMPWIGAHRPAEIVGIGIGWIAPALVFSFSSGLWRGKSLQVMLMLEAYTFNGGNIRPPVHVVTALAPYLAVRLMSLT